MLDTLSAFLSSDWSPFVIFGIVLIILYFYHRQSSAKQAQSLEQQALKRNGTVKKGNIFSYPRLSIFQESVEVSIYSTPGGKNIPPYTHVACALNSTRDYKIKICRACRIFAIGTVFGQDIKTDNPDFDGSFVIKGSDEMIVREFLSRDIQAKLLEMKDRNPILEIKKNKFKFFVPQIPKDEQEYDQLIDAGLVLIKHAQEMG